MNKVIRIILGRDCFVMRPKEIVCMGSINCEIAFVLRNGSRQSGTCESSEQANKIIAFVEEQMASGVIIYRQ